MLCIFERNIKYLSVLTLSLSDSFISSSYLFSTRLLPRFYIDFEGYPHLHMRERERERARFGLVCVAVVARELYGRVSLCSFITFLLINKVLREKMIRNVTSEKD